MYLCLGIIPFGWQLVPLVTHPVTEAVLSNIQTNPFFTGTHSGTVLQLAEEFVPSAELTFRHVSHYFHYFYKR